MVVNKEWGQLEWVGYEGLMYEEHNFICLMTSDKTLNTPYGQGSVRQMYIKQAQPPDPSNTFLDLRPLQSQAASHLYPLIHAGKLRPLHLYTCVRVSHCNPDLSLFSQAVYVYSA